MTGNDPAPTQPVLPNFLIVGAMKGGTSSLAHMLRQHPDIYIPAREVHFFDKPVFRAGRDGYAPHFSDWQGERAIGEKTPTYSHHPGVPRRVARLLPDVKIIWIFREPVARAYSHYWFFVSMGKERLSFPAALAREERGQTEDYTMRYRERSLYARQVRRFLKYFPREQMLFLLFEEFVERPDEVLARTCRFLGVDDAFPFPERPARKNVTIRPRSLTLQWLAYRLLHGRGARVLRRIRRLNRVDRPGYPPLDPALREALQDYFAPYNARLARLTGLNLASWQPQAARSRPGLQHEGEA